MSIEAAAIVLADGTVFEGEAFGARAEGGVTTGEFVFNTVLSGYQEVISDPSYAGQIVTFTAPHIGNYGVNAIDDESARPRCSGVVIRELARRHSSWRSEGGLDEYLRRHGVAAIAGVDTRRLTRHLRDHGALPGAFGTADEATLREAALAAAGTDGIDLVAGVTTAQRYS
ncbi:MAG: carbamoyl phosphate synthase small subunit, partial [Actinomycetota bacterium]|nr:carbamoyl phosphate synthase small subunit [Actinomycetota bacterium]